MRAEPVTPNGRSVARGQRDVTDREPGIEQSPEDPEHVARHGLVHDERPRPHAPLEVPVADEHVTQIVDPHRAPGVPVPADQSFPQEGPDPEHPSLEPRVRPPRRCGRPGRRVAGGGANGGGCAGSDDDGRDRIGADDGRRRDRHHGAGDHDAGEAPDGAMVRLARSRSPRD